MASDEIKQQMYKEARKATSCDQKQWARIFNLGGNKGQHHVSYKESGARGVNMPEALAAQLLSFISEQGFDVKSIKFDENGFITDVPKQAKVRFIQRTI
jgi:hypothetical protein